MLEFERMLTSLRKSRIDLSRLVEELEDRDEPDGLDMRYCQETLKKIEEGLRKIRKIESKPAPSSDHYGASFANCAW